GTPGAGAFIDGGAPRFEDCLFEHLRTRHDLAHAGGAVHVRSLLGPATPAFVRTTFRDNAANQGGGAYVEGPDDAHARFLSCHFEANRALSGGALDVFHAALAVVGSPLAGNRAEGETVGRGGGIRL